MLLWCRSVTASCFLVENAIKSTNCLDVEYLPHTTFSVADQSPETPVCPTVLLTPVLKTKSRTMDMPLELIVSSIASLGFRVLRTLITADTSIFMSFFTILTIPSWTLTTVCTLQSATSHYTSRCSGNDLYRRYHHPTLSHCRPRATHLSAPGSSSLLRPLKYSALHASLTISAKSPGISA